MVIDELLFSIMELTSSQVLVMIDLSSSWNSYADLIQIMLIRSVKSFPCISLQIMVVIFPLKVGYTRSATQVEIHHKFTVVNRYQGNMYFNLVYTFSRRVWT